jgi:hypothetical protein
MTSALRRNRPTIALGLTTPARTALRLLGLSALFLGASASAQERMQYQSASNPQEPVIGQPTSAGPAAMPIGAPQGQGRWAGAPSIGDWRGTPVATGGVGQPPTAVAQQPPGPGTSPLNQRPGTTLPEAAQKELADLPEYQIQLEPPGPQRLFRLESEQTLQERMRQEARQRPTLERIAFPEEPVLSTEAYVARVFPPAQEVVEPNYVCYRRLYFEDKNSERYGWDLGFVQPFLSAGIFYWDVVTLPYHMGTEPCRKFECSAGYCLPGDAVPYLLYPPELNLTGTAIEAGTIVSLFAIFPG